MNNCSLARKSCLAATVAFFLSTGLALAQTTQQPAPVAPHLQQTQNQRTNHIRPNSNCDHPGYKPGYSNYYNGYQIPVYPGPNAPLPPTGFGNSYYYNNGFNGYYNNGYYNNGYYNNGYYNNGQINNYQGFPPFQRY